MSVPSEPIRELLFKTMQERGKTWREMEKILGISRASLSWIKNANPVTSVTMHKVALWIKTGEPAEITQYDRTKFLECNLCYKILPRYEMTQYRCKPCRNAYFREMGHHNKVYGKKLGPIMKLVYELTKETRRVKWEERKNVAVPATPRVDPPGMR